MDQPEYIYKYLEGDLNKFEQEEFEQKLATDQDFAEQVDLYRTLESSLSNRKEIAVEETLASVMESIDPLQESPQKAFPFRRFLPLSVTAAAVVLLLVGIRLTFFNDPATPEKVYAQHYTAYDGSGELRSGEGIPGSLLNDALDAYDIKDYDLASKMFLEILKQSPDNPRALFYLGICYLERNEPDLARQSFLKVIQEGQNLYIIQARWYTAMSCLKLNDGECVRIHLEPLGNLKGRYQESAVEILEELKR